MAATFVVEDGTGLANANSYVSEADADLYFENHRDPASWTGALSAAKQDALRMATQYIDATFRHDWQGTRIRTTMALAWPQYGVENEHGHVVAADAVPQEIKDATCELARREIDALAAGDYLIEDEDAPGGLEAESVKVGPIAVSQDFVGQAERQVRYELVHRLISGLLEDGDSGRLKLA